MAEPRKANGLGAGGANSGGKSVNMIRSQRERIQDAMQWAYYRAENGNYAELDAELNRLNSRMRNVNRIAQRYEDNIRRQPEQEETNRQLGALILGNRSPEDARRISQQINEIRNRRNNIRYPRSIYARQNNRR